MEELSVITSKDNALLKRVKKLYDRKERERSGRYIIEGYRAVKDSLPYLDGPELLLSETAHMKYGAEFSGVKLSVCTDYLFSGVSDTENAQGVVCVAAKRPAEKEPFSGYVLFLDRVRDPGNLGTVIRTALATGFDEILCRDCVDPYNPKTVRSAASAVSRVRVFSAGTDDLATLKSSGYTICCADMGGENVFKADLPREKVCLVIGNEANGVSEEVSTMCDRVLALPMKAGESLNAGISAAVLMYLTAFGAEK